MNEVLHEAISKGEILLTLSLFQKSKIQGPNWITVDFYVGFFDLIKANILKVVQESQISSKILASSNKTFLPLIPKYQDSTSFEEFKPISY